MKNLLLIIIFLLIICLLIKKEESFDNIKSKNKNDKKNIVLKNSVGHFNIYIPSIRHD